MQLRPGELGHVALDALHVAVVVVDKVGNVTRRNPAADRLLPAGAAIADVLRCRDGDGFAINWSAELAAAAATGESLFYSALRLQGDAGARVVDVRLIGLNHPNGAAVATVEDVTDRESLRRRLATSERMAAVGTLAAKVAHELNNPLDGILRYIGLAERTCDGAAADKTRKYLDSVRTGVTRMADIVADLLNYSRSAGRNSEMTPVRSLIDQAIEAMIPHLEAGPITVLCDTDDGQACPVPGDLFQVLCNLIKNAADAMDGGGRLTITARIDEQVVITVADTGPGVPEEDLGEIFNPFFTTKTDGKGTGLGLSICREIARRAGGDIIAANRPDGGALFTLTAARGDRSRAT